MPPAGKPFVELPFPPRTYDIDFAGIVNNAVYIRWLEDLRLALMAADLSDRPRAARRCGADPALDQHRVRKAGDDPGRRLGGRMWVPRMERVKWHVAADFAVGDARPCARRTGRAVHPALDAAADRAAVAAARALRVMTSFMAQAIAQAEAAAARGEVPVGAVLVEADIGQGGGGVRQPHDRAQRSDRARRDAGVARGGKRRGSTIATSMSASSRAPCARRRFRWRG